MNMKKEISAPEPLIYTKAQLVTVLGLGKSAIDDMRRAGHFPEPVLLGGRKLGWPVEAIKEWVNNRPKVSSVKK